MAALEALAGKRILLVEDEYYSVKALITRLAAMEVVIAGASPSVDEALGMIASLPDLDGAILDINLGGEMVFPVADELERRGLPFVFATAYAPEIVPARHADKIVLRKPLDDEGLAVALSKSVRPQKGVTRGSVT